MAEVVGLLLAGGPLIVALLPVVIKVTTSFGVRYRHARFGHFWGRVVYLGKLIDTDALQQKHWDINRWKDQEVMDWKAAHLASCSAIAVAVSTHRVARDQGIRIIMGTGSDLCHCRPHSSPAATHEYHTLVSSSLLRFEHGPGRHFSHYRHQTISSCGNAELAPRCPTVA